MLHEDLYSDMDPDYKSAIFRARKKLIGSIAGHSILPDYDLCARGLLDQNQMHVVKAIRKKRLSPVLDRFAAD